MIGEAGLLLKLLALATAAVSLVIVKSENQRIPVLDGHFTARALGVINNGITKFSVSISQNPYFK